MRNFESFDPGDLLHGSRAAFGLQIVFLLARSVASICNVCFCGNYQSFAQVDKAIQENAEQGKVEIPSPVKPDTKPAPTPGSVSEANVTKQGEQEEHEAKNQEAETKTQANEAEEAKIKMYQAETTRNKEEAAVAKTKADNEAAVAKTKADKELAADKTKADKEAAAAAQTAIKEQKDTEAAQAKTKAENEKAEVEISSPVKPDPTPAPTLAPVPGPPQRLHSVPAPTPSPVKPDPTPAPTPSPVKPDPTPSPVLPDPTPEDSAASEIADAKLAVENKPDWPYVVLTAALQDDKKAWNFLLEEVRQYPDELENATKELQSHKEVVQNAVRENGMLLEFASEELKANEEEALMAVHQAPDALKFVSDGLNKDEIKDKAATMPTNLDSAYYHDKVGWKLRFRVKFTSAGSIWGDSVYSDDSCLATSAVHAGIVTEGDTDGVEVDVVILGGEEQMYKGSKKHGITSGDKTHSGNLYKFVKPSGEPITILEV